MVLFMKAMEFGVEVRPGEYLIRLFDENGKVIKTFVNNDVEFGVIKNTTSIANQDQFHDLLHAFAFVIAQGLFKKYEFNPFDALVETFVIELHRRIDPTQTIKQFIQGSEFDQNYIALQLYSAVMGLFIEKLVNIEVLTEDVQDLLANNQNGVLKGVFKRSDYILDDTLTISDFYSFVEDYSNQVSTEDSYDSLFEAPCNL